MFFRKKKKEPYILLDISAGNINLNKVKITDLPLKESVIIQKSVELYDDPSPCYIHKNAVSAVLYEELRGVLTQRVSGGKSHVRYNEIPPWMKEYMDFDGPYDIICYPGGGDSAP